MDRNVIRQTIESGRAVLGVELGSTRIKAVLIGEDHSPVAMGAFDWENRLENDVWTYHLDDVWTGIQHAYAGVVRDVQDKYGVQLKKLGALGFSAMMHGYLPFDAAGKQLAPFRTWRNTAQEQAAGELTELFRFNVPQRWSISHLYQAILNGEDHLPEIDYLTTLAGYVHWQLTGRRVMGVGEASGMFPLGDNYDYDQKMVDQFDALIAPKGYPWKLRDIMPKVLLAGEDAGELTPEGAKLLDPTGMLEPGTPVAPPEGDAETGMAATNSVAVCTGNVSAGTSIFAMVVMEKPLSRVYPEIDIVATPTGKPVAMVHCNNCTSDINAWANVLAGFADAAGSPKSMGAVLTTLFNAAMSGEKDAGGVVNVNYLSGESVTGFEAGRPMMVRRPDSSLTFANFARSLLFGAMASLSAGMEILAKEGVKIDVLLGHGGFFKTKGTAQKLMAAALDAPVSVMETAGEGGPWGMALLAAYCVYRKENQTLEEYLNENVFSATQSMTEQPDAEDMAGFKAYSENFRKVLKAERAAVDHF